MTRKTLSLGLLLTALAGCIGDDCPDGTMRVAERCVRPNLRDAGLDGDADADPPDADPDAPGCDCSGETPLCDDAGRCVECLAPSDCDEPNESLCLGGICSGCREDAECAHLPDTPRCNTGLAVCVECRVDDHCNGGRCVDEACVSVGCLGDEDCGGQRCDTSIDECVECLSGDDCDSGRCDEAGECYWCMSDDECVGQLRCDTEARVCTECLDTSDCELPSNAVCESGTCVGCSEDEDCEHLGLASCDAGECVACTDNTHCDESAPACDMTTNTCVGCVSSADCEGSTPVCDVPNQTCVPCDSTEDTVCGAFVCDVLNKTCSASASRGDADTCETCLSDAHCAGEQVCVALTFGSTSEGGRCLTPVSAAPGGDCGNVPARMSERSESLLSGGTGLVCRPNATSCSYWLQWGTDTFDCPGDSGCGIPGEPDAVCYGVAGCASACENDDDCFGGTCDGDFCSV